MSNSNARHRLRAEQAAKAAKKRRNRIIGAAIVVIALVTAVTVGVVLLQSQPVSVSTGDGVPGSTPGATGQAGGGPVQPPNANSAGTAIVVNPGKAPDSAPLVEIFFDYQCPNCHAVETQLGPTFESLADAGTIRLEYRAMTFLDQNLRNDSSSRPAIAAACADTVGAYSAYHDQVFANQPAQEGDGYSDALLRETIPAAVGLSGDNLASFQRCYDQRATGAFVTKVAEQALADGVNGTPTVHVNGKDLDFTKLADPTGLGALIAQTAAS